MNGNTDACDGILDVSWIVDMNRGHLIKKFLKNDTFINDLNVNVDKGKAFYIQVTGKGKWMNLDGERIPYQDCIVYVIENALTVFVPPHFESNMWSTRY